MENEGVARACHAAKVVLFNHNRLLKPILYIPPAEAGESYYRQLTSQTATTELLKPTGLHQTRGDSCFHVGID